MQAAISSAAFTPKSAVCLQAKTGEFHGATASAALVDPARRLSSISGKLTSLVCAAANSKRRIVPILWQSAWRQSAAARAQFKLPAMGVETAAVQRGGGAGRFPGRENAITPARARTLAAAIATHERSFTRPSAAALRLADTPRAVWGARVGQIPKAITADELAKRSKFSHVLTRLYDGRLHAL